MTPYPSSFGRPEHPPAEPVMPFALPAVQITAVPVLDPQAMRVLLDQIREQVAQAVREGFALGLGEYDPEAAAVFVAGPAEPSAEQLAELR